MAGTLTRHPLRGYLDQLKGRITGSDPKRNAYAYAEVPDWAIRQAIEVHDDLLEALKALVRAIDPEVGHPDLESFFVEPVTRARAAIAKAEGTP